MSEDEVVTNYFYDLAYYEGIRNTLMIINKNLPANSLATSIDKPKSMPGSR